jgi:hypothetical protein
MIKITIPIKPAMIRCQTDFSIFDGSRWTRDIIAERRYQIFTPIKSNLYTD